MAALKGDATGQNGAVLGPAPKTSAAPKPVVILTSQDAGATARAFDPEGMDAAGGMLRDVTSARSACDAVALVTEWDVLRVLDLRQSKAAI